MTDQSKALTKTLEWRGDVPVSTRFDDPYFSLDDGLAETRHVFLQGNALPARFAPGFHIAELGFGTGLNLLAAWHLWRVNGTEGPLRFTSFEAFPLDGAQMLRAQAAFPALQAEAQALAPHWKDWSDSTSGGGIRRIKRDDLILEVIEGDARETLPQWSGMADAWFLDGFSPAKNPELWSDALMGAVAGHTAPGGTLATYTAAGHVRRALAGSGLEVTRVAGYGRKRHMTTARAPQTGKA